MIDLNKDSNEKHIKLLNKGNNFYLVNDEIVTNIYYGEKEIYKLSVDIDDENKNNTVDVPDNSILYDSIYPVDVEKYILKTGKLDLIDVDSPKFDIITALWIYLCWYELIRYDLEFKEEFITDEDKENGISEEKRAFFDLCFNNDLFRMFLSSYAYYNLQKRIAIYKKNCNRKIDKFIEPLIKKMEKSKVLFNYLNGKNFMDIFSNKISNYDFLKKNIFVPRKYEYTDEKLHEYNFKIWIKEMNISNNGDLASIYLKLGNKNNGFKESGFKIFLFINNLSYVEPKFVEYNFQKENITPNDINDNQDIVINYETFSYMTDLFIGIVKLSGDTITEFLKFNNKNYEEEKMIQIS